MARKTFKQKIISSAKAEKGEFYKGRRDMLEARQSDAVAEMKRAVVDTGKAALKEVGRRVEQSAPMEILEELKGIDTDYIEKQVKRKHGEKDEKQNYFARRAGAIAIVAGGLVGGLESAGVPVIEPAKTAVTNTYEYIGDAVDDSYDRNNLPPGGEPAVWDGGELVEPSEVDEAVGFESSRHYQELLGVGTERPANDPIISGTLPGQEG